MRQQKVLPRIQKPALRSSFVEDRFVDHTALACCSIMRRFSVEDRVKLSGLASCAMILYVGFASEGKQNEIRR